MADSAIAALTASDALTGTELFYADGLASAAAADVKVTAAQLKTFTSASPTLVTPNIGVATATSIANAGDTTYTAASKGPTLKQGANGRCGTFVCNGSTPVTVNNTSIAITDCIIISLNTVGGTVGAVPAVKTITASTGFTVAGTASDTSTYNYAIIKNSA